MGDTGLACAAKANWMSRMLKRVSAAGAMNAPAVARLMGHSPKPCAISSPSFAACLPYNKQRIAACRFLIARQTLLSASRSARKRAATLKKTEICHHQFEIVFHEQP